MKVTPALKKELAQWLDTYWTTYLKGDIATWATFIRDDYRNIGGTKEEIWNSKQEIIDYTYRIMDQMKGTVDIRNRKVELIPYGEYIMVHEFTDLYVKIEGEWTFYGPFRMSSLLEKTDAGWIALHQHGSYPDMKAMEGEAFSIDALKAENAKLQAAVKQRTIELEQNNRELEIEAATERVRVQSMAMQQPADLGKVNKELLTQLTKLEIPGLAGVSFYFVDPDEIVTVWDLSSPGNLNDPKSYSFRFDSKKHPVLGEFVGILKSTQQDYFILDFPKEKLLQAIEELKDIDIKIYNNFKHAVESGALLHQWNPAARITDGILSIDLMMPPTDDTKTIVLKMAGAFNQAYQRFLDLQKAEAQAREAQIEAALERTRTQSMIMQHSKELDDTLRVFHQQVLLLGIHSAFSFLWLPDEKNDRHLFWAVWGEDEKGSTVFKSKAINYPLERNEPATAQCLEDWKSNEPVYSYRVQPEGVENYFAVWQELIDGVEHLKPEYFSGGLYYVEAFMKYGCFGVMVETDLTEAEKKLLSRFAIEFERTYTRFLDLQKAEAQAREAQIEAALERVRVASMAMRDSSALSGIIDKVYVELTKLDTKLDRCFIMVVNPENKGITWWMAGQEGLLAENGFFVQMNQHPSHLMYLDNCKKRKKKWTYLFEGKEKRDWDRFGFSKTELARLPEPVKKFMAAAEKVYLSGSSDQFGSLVTGSFEPLPEEQQEIISRFTIAFNQAYIRFLDLQKAEAQAREAQIEAALERVRTRTMAMQHSKELSETVTVMFAQFKELGEEPERMAIEIVNEKEHVFDIWATQHGGSQLNLLVQISLDEPHVMQKMYKAWKAKTKSITIDLQGNELEEYFQFLKKAKLPVQRKIFGNRRVQNVATFSKGILTIITPEPRPQETIQLLERFAAVFDGTYTRFLDLQKAEAQAREAQIEAALERVRSRSMAMHTSQELKDVALELRKQMGLLGQKDLEVCAIHLYDEENSFESWSAMKTPGSESEILQTQARFPNKGISIVDELMNHKNRGSKDYVLVNEGEKMAEWFKVMKQHAPELHVSIKQSIGKLPIKKLKANWSVADFSGGALVMVTYGDPDVQSRNLLRRSANVFEQAYIRFLDLQKAEAQAREAQIEAALERVRSRTMAMHKSEDLSETSVVLFNELNKLGIQTYRSGFGIYDEVNQAIQLWLATISDQFSEQNVLGTIPLQAHYAIRENYTAWKEKKSMMVHTFSGKEVKEYYQKIGNYLSIALQKKYPDRLVFSVFFFSEGSLNVMTDEPLTEDDNKIMLRFSNVFGLTYRRFLDLQKAEAQAREAQIEVALERVRSRSMAMQHSAELGDVAAELFAQMNLLVTNLWTCGFVLCEKNRDEDEWWLSMDTGFTRGFFLPNIGDYAHATLYEGWMKGDAFRAVQIAGEALQQHYDWLMNLPVARGIFEEMEKAGLERPDWQKLHAAYFSKGYLVLITREACDEEEIFKRFAQVFDQTYTRFLDLQKAEQLAKQAQVDLENLIAAKKKTDEALTELKATQSQLIQSEKMASLGELTAGIAHEIQNPLNFVNNFSEVSKELLDEMREAIEKGDTEDAKEIMNDVIQNLEKINHHGKRADGIVKGMLQHSRSSSGQKEATDINALADEYLRLSYHGLRAKDKSFNATLKTDFDSSIGLINIIPQDMGRVILNLITNAFYVVNEKAKQGIADYEPTVEVSTKKEKDKIEIKVKDNGNGIPQKILDKIFQPFFTTKPTGQGTGLGLSLSYDIVKAHGGDLRVETKEGEGSTFIIALPA